MKGFEGVVEKASKLGAACVFNSFLAFLFLRGLRKKRCINSASCCKERLLADPEVSFGTGHNLLLMHGTTHRKDHQVTAGLIWADNGPIVMCGSNDLDPIDMCGSSLRCRPGPAAIAIAANGAESINGSDGALSFGCARSLLGYEAASHCHTVQSLHASACERWR